MYGGPQRKVAKADKKGSKSAAAAAEQPEAGGAGKGKVELLVFGYACKLFREDEKALYHEHGKHLIPWMGDSKIMIDRYDGRGHLHDLSEYDAEYSSWNRNYNLSEEEARIEALCDEERYLALHTNLLEEEARQEEEYKRLSEALAEDGTYNAVGFSYSSDYYDPSQPTEEEDPQKEMAESESLEENEEPYIAPLGLNVPPDVELPATTKMHAIIERTANFVCKQGAQFEIMLKAKQARNSQFDFLRFDHYLNPYYKYILKVMKQGRYTPQAGNKGEEEKGATEDEEDEDEEGGYLHPSLFASKKCSRLEELMKPLKVIDPDHPLAALVRKAQTENDLASQQTAESSAAQISQMEYSTDTTEAAVYYSYYMLPDGTYCLAAPPPGMEVAGYYSGMPAEITATTATGLTVPPPPGTTPPPPSSTADSSSTQHPTATSATSVLAPAAIIPPPPDIQPVLDKLAEYVARNGIKFETSVHAKNDPRFEFLQPWHQYNAYYEFKKQFFMQREGSSTLQGVPASDTAVTEGAVDSPAETLPEDTASLSTSDILTVTTDAASSPDKPANEGKLVKASFAPISFAIKAKENDLLPLEKNRVKLDDSDDDGGGKEGQENVDSVLPKEVVILAAPPVIEEKKPQLSQEELEAKQAKQKLEDRLAAAAREKLAQASKESKEKQLQAERKRKAALFLQTLKNPLAETEPSKVEESSVAAEVVNNLSSGSSTGAKAIPAADAKVIDRPPSKIRGASREQEREKEKKKKKHKRRSRSRSQSRCKHHSRSKSRSRSRSKAKHALPSAYRTVRHSRSRSRSPNRRAAHASERRREERVRERSVPSAYRISNSPGISRKRSRSRSPYEKKKKRRSRSRTKSKARSRSKSSSPKRSSNKNAAHSTSISPVESRESSQDRSRGVSQEKDGQVSSAIVSSVQSKITQDLMAKVRAMLAASKNIPTGAS
ncbi:splicing factor, suppressor of white-apricot homolog isoform X2 [Latimeria chalumnae]|uniref:splicing factor, suppressor of white-apricot homolog isoform X2 n=1 Tax=Latimeria chalumnae TaxID=7897 RepID=UPI0006D92877|nr:PREDICTED: splicing factor, suppressor of white-apricot homolog [Latimeria chalumnae]|eukprot:XP_014345220.1 PREDICTED: splicing factor, suppressor of white-apricot homolog [Latimeria chalumnae]